MSDEQVRNEVMTFMFGGHETVAAGLSWTPVPALQASRGVPAG